MSTGTQEQLPHGWSWAMLSEIAEINPSTRVGIEDEAAPVNFVPMRAVAPEGRGLADPEVRPLREVRKGYTTFLSGDVIMAKITPCMENGKITVVPDLPESVCFGSTEFHVLRPEPGIRAPWISYFLLRHDVRRAAQRQMTGGVGQMRVPASFLETMTVPVPPTAEQDRISETLDELLSELDAGLNALERASAKLKLYRASVLKAAVKGDLTTDWRAAHSNIEPAAALLERILKERRRLWEEKQLAKFQAARQTPATGWRRKYTEPLPPDITHLPGLPSGWCWARLGQLGWLDRGKSKHRPRDAEFLYGGAYPFVQTGDVRRAGGQLREHRQTYSDEGLAQSKLWPAGTLCITIAANIAETAILSYSACFPDSIVGATFSDDLVRTDYIQIFFQGAKDRISAYAPATAQKNINNEILRGIAIPLPPFEEQEALIEASEEQTSTIDHLSIEIESRITSLVGLRQSLLRHAFNGQLVPQRREEEPAHLLLERIATERAERKIAKRLKPKKLVTSRKKRS